MIDPNKNPFVILSANTENQTPVDAFQQSYALKQYLHYRKLPLKVVSGCFEGKIEVSFLLPNFDQSRGLEIAQQFKQDCILVVNQRREAKLLYTNGTFKPLGYFLEGQSDDNYTIADGIKYVCTGA